MYRKCVFCGWGRKDVTDFIKFFSLPNTPGLQKFRWLQVLSEKCQAGVRSKDSVCSLHFCTGKPSTDQTHIDFVPTRYLEENSVPSEIVKKALRNKIDTPKEPTPKKAKKHLSLQEEARKPVKRKPRKNDSENTPATPLSSKEGATEPTERAETLDTAAPSSEQVSAEPPKKKPLVDSKTAQEKQSKAESSSNKTVAKQLPEAIITSKVFLPKRTQAIKYRKISAPLTQGTVKTITSGKTVTLPRRSAAPIRPTKPSSVAMEVVVDGEDSYSIPISG